MSLLMPSAYRLFAGRFSVPGIDRCGHWNSESVVPSWGSSSGTGKVAGNDSTSCGGSGLRTDLMMATDARIWSQIRFFRSVMG